MLFFTNDIPDSNEPLYKIVGMHDEKEFEAVALEYLAFVIKQASCGYQFATRKANDPETLRELDHPLYVRIRADIARGVCSECIQVENDTPVAFLRRATSLCRKDIIRHARDLLAFIVKQMRRRSPFYAIDKTTGEKIHVINYTLASFSEQFFKN
ncbi:MAG: hypothetical protein WC477_03170 [Patescibacteria group bacterium]